MTDTIKYSDLLQAVGNFGASPTLRRGVERARLEQIFGRVHALTGNSADVSAIHKELAQIWNWLKNQQPSSEADISFQRLLEVVTQCNIVTALRSAKTTIEANVGNADKTKELLIEAARVCGQTEDYYLDKWQSADELNKSFVANWWDIHRMDVLEFIRVGDNLGTRGAATEAVRQKMLRDLVDAIRVPDFDPILAKIVAKLMGGHPSDSRDMLHQNRQRKR